MEKVPNMISTKDLLYIGDMFNWNMIAAKKFELFLNEIQDEECNKTINKLCNMHYQICADLTDLLEEDGK
ncbi:MAG: hypothetical protein WC277_04325 [Bacilli bacterium]